MAVFKCKMCGGNLDVEGAEGVVTCDYCGITQTISKSRDEVIYNYYNRANNLRIKCEFDRAAQTYEKILDQDNTEAEAYWGVVLCRYGIEYVEDPTTHNRIPTCHRTSYEAITADADYIAALEYADSMQKSLYEQEAKAIDEIQKNILSIVKQEKPFDVFICYKENDACGNRTIDSAIANDIYYQLTREGIKTFYAPITLEDKLGHEYEPYIFAALHSAKVMLVIGTKLEYFEAVWVRNEWSRFLKIIKNDRSKLLIPCYRDMDAYELPSEFAHLQAQDMSKIGFLSDVVRGIKKVINPSEETSKTADTTLIGEQNTNIAPLLRRIFLFLEDEEWNRADEFCEQVLNQDPENGEAYIAKLLIEFRCSSKENLKNLDCQISQSKNFAKILRFGNEEQKAYIRSTNDSIISRSSALKKEKEQKEKERQQELAKLELARKKEHERMENERKQLQEEKVALATYKGTVCPHCGHTVPNETFHNVLYDIEGNGEITCPTCKENLYFEGDYIRLVLIYMRANWPKIKKPDDMYFDVEAAAQEIKALTLFELEERIRDDYTWSEGYRYMCQNEWNNRMSRLGN